MVKVKIKKKKIKLKKYINEKSNKENKREKSYWPRVRTSTKLPLPLLTLMKKLYIPKNSYLLKEIIKTKINKTSY